MKTRIFTGLLLFYSIGAATADDDEFARRSLGGLRGFEVLIEKLRPEVERTGLTTEVVRTDVELRLRQSGILVLSHKMALQEPGTPELYVNVNVTTGDSRLWGYGIGLELNQYVSLERDPAIQIMATTWSIHTGGGAANPSQIGESVRGSVRSLIDRFMNSYLSVNPRK